MSSYLTELDTGYLANWPLISFDILLPLTSIDSLLKSRISPSASVASLAKLSPGAPWEDSGRWGIPML